MPLQYLHISEDQVKSSLQAPLLISALEAAFRRKYDEIVIAPSRSHFTLPSGSVFLTMPCYDSSIRALGIKLVSIGETTIETGRVQADFILFDADNRRVLAVIAANHLTDLRTAAVSAIATKLLARSESRTLGIFGTGRQAEAHISVLTQVMDFQIVRCCGSERNKSQEFADRIFSEYGIKVEPASADDCAGNSDVVCTCTTSVTPLFDNSVIRLGTHLNLVGTFQASAQEVDAETIRRSRLFVETFEGALSEAGDILTPLANGAITRDHIVADLHELLSGQRPGRRNCDEITVFKSVGYAYEDLITANLVYSSVISKMATVSE